MPVHGVLRENVSYASPAATAAVAGSMILFIEPLLFDGVLN